MAGGLIGSVWLLKWFLGVVGSLWPGEQSLCTKAASPEVPLQTQVFGCHQLLNKAVEFHGQIAVCVGAGWG